MKRIGFLYEKITSLENIVLAIRNATKNKQRKHGIVKEVFDHPDKYAVRVKKLLDNGTYYFAPPRHKTRIEHGKVRQIKVPQFYPDQIIHWALMQVLTPIINRGMDRYCCGSVAGRGTRAARQAVDHFVKTDPRIKYVYKADIHHFFASVDTSRLKSKFRRVIKDAKVLKLIDEILDNGGDGLPIGYYTSQGFSNFYLQDFDHFVKEKLKIKHYVRYADDIVFLDRNKRKLHKAHTALESFLRGEHLQIKGDWQVWRYGSRPIDFVGYRFYKGYTLLRKKMFYSLTRAVRKIKRFGKRYRQILRLLTYFGWTKRINFRRYYVERIKPIISKSAARKIVSLHARTLGANAAA